MNVVSKSLNKLLFASVSFLMVSFSVNVTANCMNDTLEGRIAPVGRVCVEGQECKEPVAKVTEVKEDKGPRSGEEVVEEYCGGCHKVGAMGAPKIGDTFRDLKAKGVDALLSVAKTGKNSMPKKGNCGDCSDKELRNAIEYMLSQ